MDLVYGSSSVVEEDLSDSDKIKASVVYYAFLKRRPTGAGKETVKNVIELQGYPDMALTSLVM